MRTMLQEHVKNMRWVFKVFIKNKIMVRTSLICNYQFRLCSLSFPFMTMMSY